MKRQGYVERKFDRIRTNERGRRRRRSSSKKDSGSTKRLREKKVRKTKCKRQTECVSVSV